MESRSPHSVHLAQVQERTLFRPRVLARERPRDTSPPGADCFDKLYAKAVTAWQEKEQQLEQQERCVVAPPPGHGPPTLPEGCHL